MSEGYLIFWGVVLLIAAFGLGYIIGYDHASDRYCEGR
jgi:hypothetical protein